MQHILRDMVFRTKRSRHGRRPTGVTVELGRLWFVKCKHAIRGPFLVTAVVQQCTIKTRLYAEDGDTSGETRHSLGYGRREGSRRQVPGFADKTEEDERRRTGKRMVMVDLTLNETF